MDTISPEYLAEQQKLHENPNYGVASLAFAPTVAALIRDNNVRSVTDYGAGKKRLQEGLAKAGVEVDYYPYDPAFPEYGEPRVGSDMVACIDVLEHIEPDRLEAVLEDLWRLKGIMYFVTVHMGPAAKVLSDGRNAHLTQQPPSWWLPRLCRYFEVHHVQRHNLMGQGFWCVLTANARPESLPRTALPDL